ncbi:hypothetical protein M9435_003596 [Picochlorum sp. BPE23]|nr:hypothetical protein M9435_003596 [Picochlorum sp. BPE23]
MAHTRIIIDLECFKGLLHLVGSTRSQPQSVKYRPSPPFFFRNRTLGEHFEAKSAWSLPELYALNNSTPIAASSIAFATPGTIGNTQQENAQNVPNLSDTGGEIQEFLQKMHANIDAKLEFLQKMYANMDAKIEEILKSIIASETRLELMMERKMDMLLANTSCLHEGLASLTGQLEVSAHQNAQANIINRQAHQNITLEEHAQRIFKVEDDGRCPNSCVILRFQNGMNYVCETFTNVLLESPRGFLSGDGPVKGPCIHRQEGIIGGPAQQAVTLMISVFHEAAIFEMILYSLFVKNARFTRALLYL